MIGTRSRSSSLAIAYRELAALLDLSPSNTIHQDAEVGRPFIAARVVSEARGGVPAVGFFDYARRFGRFTDDPNGVKPS